MRDIFFWFKSGSNVLEIWTNLQCRKRNNPWNCVQSVHIFLLAQFIGIVRAIQGTAAPKQEWRPASIFVTRFSLR